MFAFIELGLSFESFAVAGVGVTVPGAFKLSAPSPSSILSMSSMGDVGEVGDWPALSFSALSPALPPVILRQ